MTRRVVIAVLLAGAGSLIAFTNAHYDSMATAIPVLLLAEVVGFALGTVSRSVIFREARPSSDLGRILLIPILLITSLTAKFIPSNLLGSALLAGMTGLIVALAWWSPNLRRTS